MLFKFENQHDRESMTAMARALRKTVRAKQSKHSRIFGWTVVALAFGMTFLAAVVSDFSLSPSYMITFALSVLLAVVLLFEDNINGYFALKRMAPGTMKATVVFGKDCFTSTTELGVSTFEYNRIQAIAESDHYFTFIFNQNHAQVYDKRRMTVGTPDEFRTFIEGMTGKSVQKV